MTNTQAIILGTIQGLTEYLPISSSAHLVLVPHFMGWQFLPKESFVFDVLVQLGTLFGVLIYFFKPIGQIIQAVIQGLWRGRPLHNETARLGWLVALASIPAAIIGFVFKSELAFYYSTPVINCYFLILTGALLVLAERMNRSIKEIPTKKDAVVIGFAQSIALFPGISRSGATIAAGMACGLSREYAAQFSFLMSIPIMLGASMVTGFDFWQDHDLILRMSTPLLLGFLSALITGYLVISWFMTLLKEKKLTIFAWYCFALGLLGIVYFKIVL